jgi:hypothetical protein
LFLAVILISAFCTQRKYLKQNKQDNTQGQTRVLSKEDELDSLFKEYSLMVKSVLTLYNLRFKVITVYVVGLLASLLASLPFVPNLGVILAIGQTILMLFLDFTIEGRQVLFSQKATGLEDEIYRLRGPTYVMKTSGFFNLYYEKCWKDKPIFKNRILNRLFRNKSCKKGISKEECYKNRVWHFIFTRGIMYVAIIVFLLFLAFIIQQGIIETSNFTLQR